jgi:hypothetical protein
MPTLLRALIDERNWQYVTFKGEFERAARDMSRTEQNPDVARLSVSESTFERWCAGTSTPQPTARRVLVHMFGYAIDELMAPAPQEGSSSPVSARQRPAESGADMHEMGKLTAMAANRALRWAITAEANQLGPETMTHVQDEVRRLARAYPTVPLGAVLGDLVETQDLVFRILESGRAKPGQARDLHLMAAITSGMLAKASHDLGDSASAMRQARAAYICADQADHAPMRGWVRGLQSLIAYWAGRPMDSAHYAQSGAAAAPRAAGTVAVWLASLQARAHAILGDSEAVGHATAAALTAREVVTADDLDDIGGLMTFPHARQLYYTAEAEVLLPELPPGAEAHARAAVEAFSAAPPEEWAFSDEAGAYTNLALARIAAGDVEGAAEAARPVLDLPPEKRPAGVILSAQRVHHALNTGVHRAATTARDLRAEIEAFATASARALPR